MNIDKVLDRYPNKGRGVDYEVDVVSLKDGGKGIFKGNMKADPYSIIPLKEALAYKVDQFMNFNLVPETEIVWFEGRAGSLQRFVNGVDGQKAIIQNSFNPSFEEMQKLAIFDFVFNNCDRWTVNFLLEEDGSVHAIDNAGCFQNRDTSSCTIYYLLGQKITEKNLVIINQLMKNCKELCELMLSFEYEPLEDGKKVSFKELFSDSVRLTTNHIYLLAGSQGWVQNINYKLGLIAPEELGVKMK